MENKNINEASGLSPLDKVKLFDEYLKSNGIRGRRENIKACGDQKLLQLYGICQRNFNSYPLAQRAIENELTNRGYSGVVQKARAQHTQSAQTVKTAQTKKPVEKMREVITANGLSAAIGDITIDDFNLDKFTLVADNYKKGQVLKKGILELLETRESLKIAITYLVYSIVMKLTDNITVIKDYLISVGTTNEQLREVINNILSNEEIINKLNSLIEEYNSLNEDIDSLDKTTPYMLRNDGKLLTCGEVHPYIQMWTTASFEDNIKRLKTNLNADNCDINWFIRNTLNNEAKQYLFALKEKLLTNNNHELEDTFYKANELVNQEFCRVRTSNFKYKYGGDNGEIYFRIASEGFNWFDLIWQTVEKFKNQIKFVSIMKDRILRGHRLEFINDGKHVFNKMPVDEFLTLGGNPVIENLDEDIEKHDTLNPKLWNADNTLKQEVDEKINLIVDEFITNLQEDEIKIKIDDIILIGSNCSYNYTKDSDLDIHIVANTAESTYTPELAGKLYSAYRSLFNKNLDIDFYGIPVEIYVEDENATRISNGVYSVMNQQWIKEPVAEDIPEIDHEAFNKEFKVWEDRYNEIISKIEGQLQEKVGSELIDEIDKYINDIYEIRKTGLAKTGEYGTENLLFKEVRNKGYLDNLKELKNKLIGKALSLESLREAAGSMEDAVKKFTKNYTKTSGQMVCNKGAQTDETEKLLKAKYKSVKVLPSKSGRSIVKFSKEALTEDTVKQGNSWVNKGEDGTHGKFKTKKAADAQRKAMFANGYHEDFNLDFEDTSPELNEMFTYAQMRHYREELSRISFNQAIVQDNGMFHIYNIKEDDINRVMNRIRQLNYISWVNSVADRYDFSKIAMFGQQQARYYNIVGQIKEV